jgi:neutral ceramidase
MKEGLSSEFSRRAFCVKTASLVSGISTSIALSDGFAAPAVLRGSNLKSGVAKRLVTPPHWIPYITSSGKGTNAAFKDVHCNLFAKALVLDDGRTPIAMLAVDSIGYDNLILGEGRNFTRELRERIAEGTKLRPEAIMLTATHTHSAPETIGLTTHTAEMKQWLEKHLLDLADTVIEAWEKREFVHAFFSTTEVTGISRNRRIVLKNGKLSRYGPEPGSDEITQPWARDEQLSMLAFKKGDGSPHSILLNFTAHPVVSMLLPNVCADFPGAATEIVEKHFDGAICLFTNGAAGNINSVHVSTNYADVEQLGRRLADSVIVEWEKTESAKPIITDLSVRSNDLKLKPRPCPSLREAEEKLSKDPSPKTELQYRLAKKLHEDPLRAEVQAMRIGPVKWISLPGEPFVETGLGLKNAGASFVAGYANGWLGYFPTRSAYDEGGYEVEAGPWSRVAPGSAEQLEAAGSKLLQKV